MSLFDTPPTKQTPLFEAPETTRQVAPVKKKDKQADEARPTKPIPEIPEGSICLQSWPWLGYCQTIYPFWQVRHWAWFPERETWMAYCEAVPRTVYPGSVWWLEEDMLVNTGLVLGVPEHAEIHDWYKARRSTLPEGTNDPQVNEFVAHLNSKGDYPPFGPETAPGGLVEAMKNHGLHWEGWTRSNFYTHFNPLVQALGLDVSTKRCLRD